MYVYILVERFIHSIMQHQLLLILYTYIHIYIQVHIIYILGYLANSNAGKKEITKPNSKFTYIKNCFFHISRKRQKKKIKKKKK